MKTIREFLVALVVLAGFELGLACAFAALLAHGGAEHPKLDILAHFAPFWLAGGAVALPFALLVRSHRLRLVVAAPGIVAVVAAAMLIAPEYRRPMSPRVAADAPRQLKLIQFNTYVRNRDVEGTARWIAEQNADIVVVEEAPDGLVAAVLRRRRYHVTDAKGRNAILSRARPIDGGVPWPREGPYAEIVRASFGPKDGDFTVFGTHYAWPTMAGLQRLQAADLERTIAPYDRSRLIIAGDFNSTPWSFARRAEDKAFGLERRTRALGSWPAKPFTPFEVPAPFPFLPIDHVYAGAAWRTISVERGPRLGSDHYPVIVRLSLQPG